MAYPCYCLHHPQRVQGKDRFAQAIAFRDQTWCVFAPRFLKATQQFILGQSIERRLQPFVIVLQNLILFKVY